MEQGKAPDMIPASHAKDGKVDRTRPLCPYPQVASYKGSGSIDEAANFVCKRYEEITSRRAGTLRPRVEWGNDHGRTHTPPGVRGNRHRSSDSCGFRPPASPSPLSLPNSKVTVAQQVAPGTFTPGATGSPAPVFAKLPEFCRVAATLTPSSGSDVKIEVWLPATGWNGKFQAVGGKGVGRQASLSCDGQRRPRRLRDRWYGHGSRRRHCGVRTRPSEKVVDFGYRAVHEMTMKAKSIIDAFYGSAPAIDWNGCSQGGRQGDH